MRLHQLVLVLLPSILAGVPSVSHGQRFDQVSGVHHVSLIESPKVSMSGIGMPMTTRTTRAACDGSELRAVEEKKQRGHLLFWGGLATLLASNFLPKDESKAVLATAIGVGGGVAATFGYYMRNATIDPESVDRAFQSFRVGETKPDDVLLCIGEPSSSTMEGNESAWTYVAAKPGMFGKSSYRNAIVAFKNGVVSAVR